MPVRAAPPPVSLVVRFALASALVLGSLHFSERALAERLIPVFRAAIWVLDDSFVLTEVSVARDGQNAVLRFRANLARPLKEGGRVLYPFGWQGMPLGGYQVHCTLGGVFAYGALLLIVVLAWPARSLRERGARSLLAVPGVALLLLIDIPSTVVAELWNSVEHQFDPHALGGWMIWSRLLMGGGGFVIALLLALACIRLAAPREPQRGDTSLAVLAERHA